MSELLKGDKKALAMDKIRPVKVVDRQYITVKRVAAQIKDNAVYMAYLPDKPAAAGRAFLFTIVNTLDPEYFRRAQGEVARLRIAQGVKGQEEKVQICPEMQALLERHVELSVGRKPNAQSLAMLKMGAKKRQKVIRKPVPELSARIKLLYK